MEDWKASPDAAHWVVLVQDNSGMDYYIVNERPMSKDQASCMAVVEWMEKCRGVSAATRCVVTWESEAYRTLEMANEARTALMEERYGEDEAAAHSAALGRRPVNPRFC